VALLSWVVATSFILATILLLLDRFNVLATPPDLPNANLVDRMLGSADYRQAIWPVFLWWNLLYAIGFAASVVFAWLVAAARGGLSTFAALAVVGGIIAAIASVIPLGAVNASVWQLYCDCGFKETEVVAGYWAQTVAGDVGVWLGRFGSVTLALGLVALVRDAGGLLPSTLRLWTWLLAIALVLTPLLGITEIADPSIEEWLSVIIAAVLVPVWAIWLGRSVDAAPRSAPA
jgi:hypothetical protein